MLLAINIIVILIFISGYALYKTKKEKASFSVNAIMSFGLAGSICSLLDKTLWGGSLDFFEISNLFIFDLKDCYLTVAEITFVIIGIWHSREISVKEYMSFCYDKFKG